MARILLVEDNSSLNRLEAIALKDEGFQVDIAEDGTTAKKLIVSNTYDVLILDIMLPDMTGFELAEVAKSNRVRPPKIIVVSGITQGTKMTERDVCFSAHADAFLGKPFTLKTLITKIRELVRG